MYKEKGNEMIQYVPEGVFNFTAIKILKRIRTDQFGVSFADNVSQEINGKVSFTEKKISIICDGIKEEILLGPMELFLNYPLDSATCFLSRPLEWKAYSISNNKCIYNLDTSKKESFEYSHVALIIKNKIPIEKKILCQSVRYIGGERIEGFISSKSYEIVLKGYDYLYTNEIPNYAKNISYFYNKPGEYIPLPSIMN
jgi:hypothetical protein